MKGLNFQINELKENKQTVVHSNTLSALKDRLNTARGLQRHLVVRADGSVMDDVEYTARVRVLKKVPGFVWPLESQIVFLNRRIELHAQKVKQGDSKTEELLGLTRAVQPFAMEPASEFSNQGTFDPENPLLLSLQIPEGERIGIFHRVFFQENVVPLIGEGERQAQLLENWFTAMIEKWASVDIISLSDIQTQTWKQANTIWKAVISFINPSVGVKYQDATPGQVKLAIVSPESPTTARKRGDASRGIHLPLRVWVP